LDPAAGGPAVTHVKNREYFFDHTSKDGTTYDSRRRSVYLPVVRNNVYDVFQLFDFVDPAVQNGDRATTTVAPQALFLMNSEFAAKASEDLAAALLARQDLDDAGRVRLLYARAYGRPVTEAESARARGFVDRFQQASAPLEPDAGRYHAAAWAALCQVILSANEFVYLN
jgi:hypothetical protein